MTDPSSGEGPGASAFEVHNPPTSEGIGDNDHDVVLDFRRLSPLTPIAKSGIWLAAAAFAVGRDVINQRETGVSGAAGIAGVIVVLGLLTGFASWWRTRFRITGSELRIDTGLLSRRSRRVRLDRIVSVDINQPFIARLLSVAELRIETATTDSEVHLSYLSLVEAEEIRRLLVRHRAAETATAADQPAAAILARVTLPWHLTALLASGETISLLFLGAAALVLASLGYSLSAFGFSLAGILGLGVSFLRKLVGRWNWVVSQTPAGVQVHHGMFNLSTQTFTLSRLQSVRVKEPFLWRPWGLASLELSVAGGLRKEGEETSGLVLPAAPAPLVWALAAQLIGADIARVQLSGPGKRAWMVSPIAWRWLGFGMDETLMVSRSGWLSPITTVVPVARAQSLRVTRGPVQALLGLSTFRVDAPRGATGVTAPERDGDDARALLEQAAELAHAARLPNRAPQSPLETSNTGLPPEQEAWTSTSAPSSP